MVNKKTSEETRWAIVTYFKDKLSQHAISKKLGVSRSCVRTTIRNYQRTKSVREKTRTGRPRKLTAKQERQLFLTARRYPKLSIKKIEKKIGMASAATIGRRLLDFKLMSFVAETKPMLTVRDRLRRYLWCKKRLNWSHREWSRWIFSDESNYNLVNRKTAPRVRRFVHEKYHKNFLSGKKTGGGGSIGIWGCIHKNGVGAAQIYSNRMTGALYIETLENYLLPSIEILVPDHQTIGSYIYQQDNAPCHRAKIVKEWMKDNGIVTTDWPPYSPDLSPIENIWSHIDRQLHGIDMDSLEKCGDKIQEIFNNIPVSMCRNLIESMPRRIKMCVKARGGHFKY